jgi:nucleoside-diphosphate-sugar epimerase
LSTRPVSTLDLYAAIAAVAPIDGVARRNDDSIRVDFRPEATEQQRADAAAIASAWSWTAKVEREATVEERLAAAESKLARIAPDNRPPAGP